MTSVFPLKKESLSFYPKQLLIPSQPESWFLDCTFCIKIFKTLEYRISLKQKLGGVLIFNLEVITISFPTTSLHVKFSQSVQDITIEIKRGTINKLNKSTNEGENII